jgi:hypothetical protein
MKRFKRITSLFLLLTLSSVCLAQALNRILAGAYLITDELATL